MQMYKILVAAPDRRVAGPTAHTNGILAALAVVVAVGLLPWIGKPMFRDEGATLYSARLGWAAL